MTAGVAYKFYILTVLCSLSVSPSLAMEFECKFDTRCSEKSSCIKKDITLSIIEAKGEYKIITPGLTFSAMERVDIVNNTRSYVTEMVRNATHLLTIFPNGSTRFTSHTFLQNAISITYLGICQVKNK